MRNTLLIIMSYAGAYDQVLWSWSHYRKSGLPIMGSCPVDSTHNWPPDCDYVQPLGKEGYSTPNLIRRWVGIFNLFCADPMFASYDSIMVIEYDGIFVRPAPPVPDGVFTHLAGGRMGTLKAERFYHCPWAASRAAASVIAEEGRKLIAEGEFEGGTPDFFLGYILDRRPELKIHETGTFSVNGGNLPPFKESVTQNIKAGGWFVHGLRTQEELAWILDAAK